MLIFLCGKDTFRLARRRKYLKDEFRRKYPEGELLALDAEEVIEGVVHRSREFLEPSLFDTPRMLSLEQAEALADGDRKAFVKLLGGYADVKDRIIIVSQNGILKTNDAFAVFFKKYGKKVEEFGKLVPAEARKFLREEAARVSENVSFSREAEELLIRNADGDSARLSSDARKLASFKLEGLITPDDARSVCVFDPRESVFEALDALARGNRGMSLSMLLADAGKSGSVMPVMGMLAWQLREFFKVRGEYDRGLRNADDIARVTGGKPFTTRKALSCIDRFPLARLKRSISLLSEYDEKIKTGRMDGETALALFTEKF